MGLRPVLEQLIWKWRVQKGQAPDLSGSCSLRECAAGVESWGRAGRGGHIRGGRPVPGGRQGVPGPCGQSAGWRDQASASCETTPQPATASACACARTPPAQSPGPPQRASLHLQCQEHCAGSVCNLCLWYFLFWFSTFRSDILLSI